MHTVWTDQGQFILEIPPRSEIVFRAILQELDDMLYFVILLQQSTVCCCSWDTKVAAQLGLEGSPVLDSTDVPSSAPKQSIPEVHGLVGSPLLKSTGGLLSPLTQLILEVLFTEDVPLIDIICSLQVHEAYVRSALCVWILIKSQG